MLQIKEAQLNDIVVRLVGLMDKVEATFTFPVDNVNLDDLAKMRGQKATLVLAGRNDKAWRIECQ